MAELHEWREPATTKRGDGAEKAARQLAAAFLVAALLQQYGAEPLFKVISRLRSATMRTCGKCLRTSAR